MKKLIIYIVIIMSFVSVRDAKTQWSILKSDADSLILKGADYIYNCQFENAEEIFSKVIKQYPNNPAGYFLDAMVDWWQITTYRNSEIYDTRFLNKIDKVVTMCNNLLEDDPTDLSALFFKGGALGYRARYYVVRKSWFNAATDGYNAFKILMECYKVAPQNHDIMLGTGIYNYFAAVIPEQYPAIKPLIVFAPDGDKDLGILQLKAAAKHARYSDVEAKVVLLQIYYDFEKNSKDALPIADELHKKYPNNPMLHRYYGRCLVSEWYLSKYEETWREILLRYIDKQPGYDIGTAREALYYIGNALFYRQKYALSLKYFYKCDEASRKLDKEPSGFMILANLKIAQIYANQNNKKLLKKQIDKLLDWDDYRDSHNKANNLLKKLH